MKTITIHCPQDGIKWNRELAYLKEHHPYELSYLIKTNQAVWYLDSFVAHAIINEQDDETVRRKLLPENIPNYHVLTDLLLLKLDTVIKELSSARLVELSL